MYNLLVVDDEKFTADTIAYGIEWSQAGFDGVYVAYCALDAIELCMKTGIDVMICDIEMPGHNGIELLEWIRERQQYTETVFLTGHANFNFAQRAVRLESFDYVLKPVDYDRLREIAIQALRKQKNRREAVRTKVKGIQSLVLAERFWQDVFSERIALSDSTMAKEFDTYYLPLNPGNLIVPILFMLENRQEEMSTRDQERMKYAVRNIASEILLTSMQGAVFQHHDGNNIGLIYLDDRDADKDQMRSLCESVAQACWQYLKCKLSCYIGQPSRIEDVVSSYNRLLKMEYNPLNQSNRIILQEQFNGYNSSIARVPSPEEWSILIESGKKEQLTKKLDESLNSLQADGATPESLEALQYSIIYAIYQLFHNHNLSIYDVFSMRNFAGGNQHTRSVELFRAWAIRTMTMTVDFMADNRINKSATVEKVVVFIHKHIDEDITRELIAGHVYLNPVYISRLFKKEMNISLSDFIMQAKMDKAKAMLRESHLKISDIAEKLSYYQLSHFTKMFKKIVGLSPQEYRKKYL